MASYLPVSQNVGVTGATGASGYSAALAALDTAVNTAIGTAIGVTGYVKNSLAIYSPVAVVSGDALGLSQLITYTTFS